MEDSLWWQQRFGRDQANFGGPWRQRNKNGLTPVFPNITCNEVPAAAQLAEEQDREAKQREWFHGWSTAELIAAGALTDESVRSNNLRCQLHPAFSQNKWETEVPQDYRRDLTALGAGRNGHWVSSNQIVWNALLPSLRLATEILNKAHLFPWFDALFYGDRRPVAEHRIPAGWDVTARPLFTFHLRTEAQRSLSDGTEMQAKILHFSQTIRFGITNGCTDPRNGNRFTISSGKWNGITIPPQMDTTEGITRIYLAWQILEPLLGQDLTPSMRLVEQFHIAVTLLHEFVHALSYPLYRQAVPFPPAPPTAPQVPKQESTTAISKLLPVFSPSRGVGQAVFHPTIPETHVPAQRARPDPNPKPEMYFENERIAELGFSFENNVLGFHPVELYKSSNEVEFQSKPQLGFLLTQWPNHRSTVSKQAPRLDPGNPWEDSVDYWPMTVSWLEEIGQDDFWRYAVPYYGVEFVQPWPVLEGRKEKCYQDGSQQSVLRLAERRNPIPRWLRDMREDASTITEIAALPIPTLIASLFARARTMTHKKIETTLRKRRTELRIQTEDLLAHKSRVPLPREVHARDVRRHASALVDHIKSVESHAVDATQVQPLNINAATPFPDRVYQKNEELKHIIKAFQDASLTTEHRMSSLLLLQKLEGVRNFCGRPGHQVSRGALNRIWQVKFQNDEKLAALQMALYTRQWARGWQIFEEIQGDYRGGHTIFRTAGLSHISISTVPGLDTESKYFHVTEGRRLFNIGLETATPAQIRGSAATLIEVETRFKTCVTGTKYKALRDYQFKYERQKRLSMTDDIQKAVDDQDNALCIQLCKEVLADRFFTTDSQKVYMHYLLGLKLTDYDDRLLHAHHSLSMLRSVQDNGSKARLQEADFVNLYQENLQNALPPAVKQRTQEHYDLIVKANGDLERKDYFQVEESCIDLLGQPQVDVYQQAQAQLLLASCPPRKGRYQHANKAIEIYRKELKKSPEDGQITLLITETETKIRALFNGWTVPPPSLISATATSCSRCSSNFCSSGSSSQGQKRIAASGTSSPERPAKKRKVKLQPVPDGLSITAVEVAARANLNDQLYCIIDGEIYDPLLLPENTCPAGISAFQRAAGRDWSNLFRSLHGRNADALLTALGETMRVGTVVPS